jgi:hypothetical protein
VVDRDADRLAHLPLAHQVRALESIVRSNQVIARVLDEVPALSLGSWYIGAGGIAGTVWNHLHGYPPTHAIKDYDVVYFDAEDLGERAEQAVAAQVTELLGANGAAVDVTNEARVHTWYERRFGRALRPYRSVEHAIATWPTTAGSIGVRRDGDEFVVCAPFGLADLFAMVVRANTTLVDEAVYRAKAERWSRTWPRLTALPWPGQPSGERQIEAEPH